MVIEQLDCPICKNKNTRILISDLKACSICMHIFKNIYVDKKAYKGYVSSAHIKKNQTHIDNCYRAVNGRFNLFKMFSKKGKTLEIGSGHRYFLDKLKEEGYEPEGTELSEVMAEEIPYKMRVGNPSELDDLPIYSNICAFHVIEHMNDPVKEIKCLMKHMEDDGLFMFEIPNLIFFGKELNFKHAYEPVHTHYFTQISLMEMLKTCGLVPVLQINNTQGNVCVSTICAVKDNKFAEKAITKGVNYLYPLLEKKK